jgi:serine protease Do
MNRTDFDRMEMTMFEGQPLNSRPLPTRPARGGRMKRVLALATASAIGAGVYFGGATLVKDVQFARAEAEVQTARQNLATIQDMAEAFKAVGRAVEPSVVNIAVARSARAAIGGGGGGNPMEEEFLRRFFPDRDGDGQPDVPRQGDAIERGNGSGVILDVADGYGYILTNNHVAEGAEEMLVTLHDGREIREARLLGTDPKSDLAVIRIKADRLIPARWGDSEHLEKGDIVFAFGSPFGFVGSMTQGIVSAKNRQAGIIGSEFAYEDFLQVDASINPGNSGGPLVNLRGEVVGINTAIASRSGGFQGIGFSIPSNQARMVFEQIKEKGKVIRGWLGVEIIDAQRLPDEQRNAMGLSTETRGVFVRTVQRGTPAAGALQAGDVIVKLGEQAVTDSRELRNAVAATAPGTEVPMLVFRDGKEQTVKVRIGEQPDDTSRIAQNQPNRGGGETSAESIGLRLATPNPRQLESLGLDADAGGAIVRQIAPNSLAAQSGIEAGDVIVSVGGKRVGSAEEAGEALRGADLSKGVRIVVASREGERMIFLQQR